MRSCVTACTALLAAFVVGCGQDTFGTASDAATRDDMLGSRDALGDGGVDAAAVVDCGNPLTNPEHCGACGHRCLGGDCDSGTCMPVTLATNQAPYLIAVDNEGPPRRFSSPAPPGPSASPSMPRPSTGRTR